jgi:hypothetical protein
MPARASEIRTPLIPHQNNSELSRLLVNERHVRQKRVHSEAHRVVSAPGKVLFTGGYLVLEQPNPGLVMSTSARIFSRAFPSQADGGSVTVSVSAPQLGSHYKFIFSPSDNALSPLDKQESA